MNQTAKKVKRYAFPSEIEDFQIQESCNCGRGFFI